MTPFADVKAGYAVGDIEGAYASIGVGVRFSLKGKKALNLALMYNFKIMTPQRIIVTAMEGIIIIIVGMIHGSYME